MRNWILALLLIAPTLSGCFTDPDIEEVVGAIAWQLEPASLDTDVELRLGQGSMSFARMICGFVDDCEEYRHLVAGVRDVHLGVYTIDGPYPDDPLVLTEEIRWELEDQGWQMVMRMQERGGSAFALARLDGDDLSGLYVVSVEDDELVVVKLEGDLARPLDFVLRRDEGLLHAVEHAGDDI